MRMSLGDIWDGFGKMVSMLDLLDDILCEIA